MFFPRAPTHPRLSLVSLKPDRSEHSARPSLPPLPCVAHAVTDDSRLVDADDAPDGDGGDESGDGGGSSHVAAARPLHQRYV